MQWTHEDIMIYMDKYPDDQIYIIHKKESKPWRTLQQNNTFYKLFTDIGNHLWEDKDDVHDMMLWWTFWTREVTIWKIKKEVLIEKHTSKLDKEQGTRFIKTILAFCEKYDLPITVTSREIQSLYNTYN